MTDYTLTIEMDSTTVQQLTDMGMKLFAYKAVQAAQVGGLPLVWSVTDSYSVHTELAWRTSFGAYDTHSSITPGQRITVGVEEPVALGDRFTIDSPSGAGTVTSDGDPGGILIVNTSGTQLGCGITQQVGGDNAPVCALPIINGYSELFIPVESVLVMFGVDPISAGTAMESANSPGVLVSFDGVTSRTVTYSTSNGWSWNNASWGTAVPARADLAALLIQSSDALEQRRRAAAARIGAAVGA